jgi:membrane protease YdiL (CAAX protease family)
MAVTERRSDRGRLTFWATTIGVFSSLNYLARLSGSNGPDEPLYLWSSAIAGAIQFGVFLVLIWLIARGRPLRQYLALRQPTSWRQASWIAGGVLALVWVVGAALSPFLNPGKEQNLVPSGWDPSRAAPFLANLVVVALLAPVVEELMFRGLGYSLLEPFGRWPAILLTALAFALAHGLVEGFPVLFVFGAGLAYMRSRVDSVYPGMLLHIGFNALVLLAAVHFFQVSS